MNDSADIAKLVSSNRRLMLLCGLQALMIAVCLLAGWASQKSELTLRRLAIVDAQGRERVVLRGGQDGQGVVLLDSAGEPRCGLTVDHDLPGLRLYDPGQRARAGFVMNPAGPNLDFLRADGSLLERHPSRRRH